MVGPAPRVQATTKVVAVSTTVYITVAPAAITSAQAIAMQVPCVPMAVWDMAAEEVGREDRVLPGRNIEVVQEVVREASGETAPVEADISVEEQDTTVAPVRAVPVMLTWLRSILSPT